MDLSAGRVQTVALRLIVEREREIKAFEKKEYWTIDAHLAGPKPPAFDARFVGKGEEKIEVTNGEDAEKIRAALEKADWLVRTVDRKERRRNATPPFTTSKLQQDSSRKLRFSVKRTMMIAQRLYEGVELGEEGSVGLITYMRTDSTRVSNDAMAEVREYISNEYGKDYLPESPNVYKEKKEAQAAHEAIRPTSAMRHPEQIKQYLKEDEYKVYKLIWQRFVASQIMPAVFDQTSVDIDAKSGTETFWFRVTGSVLKFDGFLKVYEESKEGKDEEEEELKHKLPPLEPGQKLTLQELKPEQHFTEPPPRYNEASLVKELEERGIGRPSTYSAILSTIQERQYVQKLGGKFSPTEIGLVVTDLLVENFRDIFDVAIHRAAGRRTRRNRRRQRNLDRRARPTSTRNSPKTSAMPKSTWRTSSGWRSPRTRSASAAARRWSSSGASTDRSTLAALTTRKIRTAAPSPKKIPSTCRTWIPPTCRRPRRKNTARTAAG